jgi:hypothetical protein
MYRYAQEEIERRTFFVASQNLNIEQENANDIYLPPSNEFKYYMNIYTVDKYTCVNH